MEWLPWEIDGIQKETVCAVHTAMLVAQICTYLKNLLRGLVFWKLFVVCCVVGGQFDLQAGDIGFWDGVLPGHGGKIIKANILEVL